MFLLEKGFLGTSAPLFLDIITIYFTILPVLFGISIYYAIKMRHRLHFLMQTSLLIATTIIIILFEIYIRN